MIATGAVGAGIEDVILKSSDGVEVYGALRLPEGDGPFPGVLMIHGGGGGSVNAAKGMASTKSQIPLVQGVLKKDWVVFSVDYRADAVFGMEEDDAIAGLRYLMAHPKVDPDRVVCWGGSHGGHLVLRLAERFSDDLAGVAVGSPWLPDPISYLYGDPAEEPLSRYSDATMEFLLKQRKIFLNEFPLTRGTTLENYPPILHERSILENAHRITCPVMFVTSHGDDTVPHVMIEPVIKKVRSVNKRVVVYTARNAEHGFYHKPRREENIAEHRRAVRGVLSFFENAFTKEPRGR
jgi:dipeptidyl aminopeptidase/acylaminoacyl peptidase